MLQSLPSSRSMCLFCPNTSVRSQLLPQNESGSRRWAPQILLLCGKAPESHLLPTSLTSPPVTSWVHLHSVFLFLPFWFNFLSVALINRLTWSHLQARKGCIWLVLPGHSPSVRKGKTGFMRELETKHRGTLLSGPCLRGSFYTVQGHLPREWCRPQWATPPISINNLDSSPTHTDMPTGQLNRGNSSCEVPSFSLTVGCANLTIQAN